MDTDLNAQSDTQDFASRSDIRIDTKGVQCAQDSTKIRVADLTGAGMRLTVPASKLPAIGDTQSYTFTDKQSDHQLSVIGTVRWVRKGSVLTRKAEVGIEFVDLPPAHRDALVRLAVQGELTLSSEPVAVVDESEEHASQQTAEELHINLYDILAVNPYASTDEIKTAFHKLVKQWHPDHNDAPEAPARFEELHKAYAILKDPTLRARYDTRFGPDQQSDQAAA